MKKIKNESQLLQHAIKLGSAYAIQRKYVGFDATTSAKDKQECIYRLLVQDKLITPLAVDQENVANIRRKLVLWITKHLPADHSLLN